MRSLPIIRDLPTWWGRLALMLCAALLSSAASLHALDAAPIITSVLSGDGTVGSPMAYQIVASNAPTSYTAGSTAVPLPGGLRFDSATGLISGVPLPIRATTTFGLQISATNDVGTVQQTLLFTIHVPGFHSPVLGSGAQISGVAGSPLVPFDPTWSFSANGFSARDLPLGLSIDGTTGIISGTPVNAGTYNSVISVSDLPFFPPPSPTNLVFTISAGAGTTGTTTASSASASASAGGSTSASASSSATTTGTGTAADLPVAVPTDNNSHGCGLGGSLGALLVVGLLLQIRSRRS